MALVAFLIVIPIFFVLSMYMAVRVRTFKKKRDFLKDAKPIRMMSDEEVAAVKKTGLYSIRGREVFLLEGDYDSYVYGQGGPREIGHDLIGGVEVMMYGCLESIKEKDNSVEVVRTGLGLLVVRANNSFDLLNAINEAKSSSLGSGEENKRLGIEVVGERELFEAEDREHWCDENSGLLAAVVSWLAFFGILYGGSVNSAFSSVLIYFISGLLLLAALWLLFFTASVKHSRYVMKIRGELRHDNNSKYIEKSFCLGGLELWAPQGWAAGLKKHVGKIVELEVANDDHYIFSAPGLSINDQYGGMVPAKVFRFFLYSLLVSPLLVVFMNGEALLDAGVRPESIWMAMFSVAACFVVGICGLIKQLDDSGKRKQKHRQYQRKIV